MKHICPNQINFKTENIVKPWKPCPGSKTRLKEVKTWTWSNSPEIEKEQSRNSHLQIRTLTKRQPTLASIFSRAIGQSWQLWGGCVLFSSSFPKINAVFAGDNHRGAVVAMCPVPVSPLCHPKRKKKALNSHPAHTKQAEGRHKSKMCRVCIWRKLHKLWSLYRRWWQQPRKEWAAFLNLHVAGCLGANLSSK